VFDLCVEVSGSNNLNVMVENPAPTAIPFRNGDGNISAEFQRD
jgi:hypothetical protein